MLKGLHISIICVYLLICNADGKVNEKPPVEVRAVFLKCEPDDRQTMSLDNEVSRFEREEMYKHTALRDCIKKIALTVKLISEPDESTDDEYIPIEHVIQRNKRIRLLDPYVLRLRREPVRQAYKLRKIDTVNGILAYSKENSLQRFQRSSELSTKVPSVDNSSYSSLYKVAYTNDVTGKYFARDNLFQSKCLTRTSCPNKRNKRFEHNVLVENVIDDRIPPLLTEHNLGPRLQDDISRSENTFRELNEYNHEFQHQDNILKGSHVEANRRSSSHIIRPSKPRSFSQTKNRDDDEKLNNKFGKNNRNNKAAQCFTVYEIDKPELWSTVQVQLFEKLVTSEGKTLWNDLSKGAPASVSSLSPEWNDQEMNVRYRADWVPREDFTLPADNMCLLIPLSQDSDDDKPDALKEGDYIVVPREDIMTVDSTGNEAKRTADDKTQYRRVMVRMARAIIDGNENKLNMESHRGEQYLTMPYARSHRAQIELEARADENQLVNVGSTGRIIMAVSDNTRRTRTVLNVQVMNTGLTSARFRVKPRDCGPPESLESDGGFEISHDNYLLLPPKHTRHVRIVLPEELPSDVLRCSVALLSDDGDSVAVRDVSVKRGDRCFCVWHCECVCLSEDPKLLCEEMPEARQIAAGLSLRERPRHSRSVCYRDSRSLNILVTICGVLLILIILGFLKASVGLVSRYVGTFGLSKIVQMPRKLNQYYENSLRSTPVVYDDEGWPVHPETKQRTVRLISLPMEFIINLAFFILAPGIIIHDAIKALFNKCRKIKTKNKWEAADKEKNVYSSNDMQCMNRRRRRRRRGVLRRWMTTEAEELSSNIWKKGLIFEDNQLRRLDTARKMRTAQESHLNSDDDDTEFVLMQMQKSRESLAKSQKSQVGVVPIPQSTQTTHRR